MASINLNTNYTRVMKAGSIITENITDGLATLEGGTLSNLYNPVDDSDCATKYYVDNYIDPTNVSLPLNSIQINTGTNFIGVPALTFDKTTNTMNIYNKIDNGNLSITDNNIVGLDSPIESDDMANYNYMTSTDLEILNYSTTNQSNILRANQIVNVYMNRTITNYSEIVQDILPTYDSLINGTSRGSISAGTSFKFIYNFMGPAEKVLLFGNIIPNGNFLYLNNPIPVITVPKNRIVYISGVFKDNAVFYYVKNTQNIYSEPRINNVGLETADFTSYSNDLNIKLNATFIIYPVVPTEIHSSSAHTYTYTNIKNKLIIRSGILFPTTDTFDALSTFITDEAWSLGSGQIKFVIQNTSNFNLKVGPDIAPSGWSYNTNYNRTIGPGKNGFFYINYDGTNLYLYTIGIYDRDG